MIDWRGAFVKPCVVYEGVYGFFGVSPYHNLVELSMGLGRVSAAWKIRNTFMIG